MPESSTNIKHSLNSLSKTISGLLYKKEINEESLLQIEQWLSVHLNKIRIKKLEDVSIVGEQETDLHTKKDGVFILNTAADIILDPGFQNYQSVHVEHSDKINLSDLIEASTLNEFNSAFLEALAEKKNTKANVLLKTGVNQERMCLLEFDVLASNLENDRLIVYYSFKDLQHIHLSEFQSIVLNNLPGMDVFLFDSEYRYILAGGKEKQKYNLTNSSFVGKTLFEVYKKQDQRRYFQFYNKAIKGEYTEGEVRYNKDVYYIAAAPVKNTEGNTVAGILISQNVTKDKLLEAKLIKSKEEAQRANKAKSIFLANMSHEIRTPLNSIIGFADQLKKTNLDKQQQRFTSLINHSSEHLLYLVNEIVFLFKLGMDKVYIEKTNFSIKQLLSEIADDCEKQAAEKNLVFNMKTDQALPDFIKGDPFRLRQILMNLLVNALKYTEKGHVKLSAEVVRKTKKKIELLFEVSDTGIGIEEKDLAYIFDVFEQGNKRTEKIRGGAGLGLGICKKLVTLFNGDIAVTSKKNVGSTFKVSIPFELANAKPPIKKEKSYNLDDSLLRGKRILLADDDKHNRLLSEVVLKGWETDFTLVEDGEEALKELKKVAFDLVLLDIHMPKKNGIDVIKKVRANKSLNTNTPIIALTANALKADINSYLKVGFTDYVIKPFFELELYNKICNILQIKNNANKSTGNGKPTVEEATITEVFNMQELEKTAGSDKQFFNTMIDNFTENAEMLLSSFKSGLENEDWNTIGERAHKVIPSFKFFKLMNTADALSEIEDMALRSHQFKTLPETINKVSGQIEEIIKQAKAAKR
ncbi:ATP-binding protein [Draconibacterium halophilum]|uniref:histidine kinase n=1 Tax=Draconibacterium halophilum TaxID=2706887 RepID=A0A6C0RIF3_9BACT|nr:ATP-binding protein [Draconibacterium halophilum]QIA09323.1 response regulator [Draconibacterium halophilum]